MCHESGFVCGSHAAVDLSDKGNCGRINEKKQVLLNNIYIPSQWIGVLQRLVIGWVAGGQFLAGISASFYVTVSRPDLESTLLLI